MQKNNSINIFLLFQIAYICHMEYIQNIEGRSGIYIISNTIDNRIYVGSATSFRHRCAVHKRSIKAGKHGNPKLMAFANKYGIDKLIFTATFACSIEDLIKHEQEYLDRLQPFGDNGFNIVKTAGSPIGYKHTEEAKEKMKGRAPRVVSEEEKQRLSELKKGVPRSEELKNKLSKIYDSVKIPLLCYTKEGFFGEFECVGDAARKLNLDRGHIKATITKRSKTTGIYFFIKKESANEVDIEKEIKDRFTNGKHRAVICKDLRTQIEKEYNSLAELVKDIQSTAPSIVTAIKRNTLLYDRYKIKYK